MKISAQNCRVLILILCVFKEDLMSLSINIQCPTVMNSNAVLTHRYMPFATKVQSAYTDVHNFVTSKRASLQNIKTTQSIHSSSIQNLAHSGPSLTVTSPATYTFHWNVT